MWFSKWFKKNPLDELHYLPQDVPGLDKFVHAICSSFNLPENDDTYDNIATMIMHMPPSAARVSLRYLGESCMKSIANKAAYEKLAEFRNKRNAAEEARIAQLKEQTDAKLKLVDTTKGSADGEKPVQN